MNAPRPLQSPSAQMPGTLVRERVVDRDVAARVGRDAGAVEPEVVGVRPPADREQDVRADRHGLARRGSRRRTATPSSCGARLMHSAPVRTAMPSASRMSAIASETSSSSRAISRGAHLDDRHLGAEAAVHLRELEADVAAADDDQVPRQLVERQHRACW